MHFLEAAKEFLDWKRVSIGTRKTYWQDLRQFGIFMRNSDIEKIKYEDVREWFALGKDFGYESNTFVPKAEAIREFFEYFEHRKYDVLDAFLIEIPHKEFKFARVATPEKFVQFMSVLTNKRDPRVLRNRAMCLLLWDTGARIGEILSLNISDMDQSKKSAIIRTEKVRTRMPFRTIFWSDETNEALAQWIEHRAKLDTKHPLHDPDALFISVTSRKYGNRLTLKGACEFFRRNSHDAGITPVLNAHSLRHAYGKELASKGANDSTISSLMGHASPVSSFQYTRLYGKHLEEVHRKYSTARNKRLKILTRQGI